LKKQTRKRFDFILDLVAKPEVLEKPKSELFSISWEDSGYIETSSQQNQGPSLASYRSL